jgi:hypothetical protein
MRLPRGAINIDELPSMRRTSCGHSIPGTNAHLIVAAPASSYRFTSLDQGPRFVDFAVEAGPEQRAAEWRSVFRNCFRRQILS